MSADAKQNNTFIKSPYRPEIDGLRAFAVTTVIINHFNKEILPGGYLGVDMFFVISGFVITSSLYQRPSKNFKDFISGFYERRIKRLVPALSMFVLIMSIVICLFNPSPSFSLKTGLASLFGFSNLFLLKESTDYFAQSTELNVFTHTWSLGVEEQFYILFPFLVWFSGYGRQKKNGIRNLFLIVLILTIASLIGFAYFYLNNPTAGYFLMPTRFWEMAAGCLLFLVFQKRSSVEQFFEKVSPLVVLILIIGVMYLPRPFAAISTIAVVVLSCIFISSLKKEKTLFKIFTNSKVVYLGLISYSLYLWHWGVLSISRWTIGIHWWSVPFQVALMLGLAVTSFKWIETPLRKGNWFGSRWKTYIVGGGVLITLSWSIVNFYRYGKEIIYLGENNFQETIGGKNKWRFRTGKEPLGIDGDFSNCHLWSSYSSSTFPLSECTLTGRGKKTIFFAGNSHSEQYRPLQKSLREEFDGNIFSISVSTCTFPSDFGPNDCNSQKKLSNVILEESSKGDVIVVTNRYPLFNWGENKLWTQERNGEKDMLDLLSKAQRKGVLLIIFSPTPEFSIDFVSVCTPEFFRIKNQNCNASKNDLKSSRKKSYEVIDKLQEKGALVFDPMQYLCIKNQCPLIETTSNRLIYPDGSHISTYAVEKFLRKPFVEFLLKYKIIE